MSRNTKSLRRAEVRRRNHRIFGASMIALTAAMAPSNPTLAQSDEAAESGSRVEQIVVTARKREEGIQDAPVSITAFTGEDLAARSVENLSNIGEFTPNLTFNNATEPGGANSAQVFIRGVGQQDFLIVADPGVGIYTDGVYLGRATGGVLDITDVAQVDVLRGPQGTLFGRNTVGGAINVVLNKPTDEFEGYIEGIVGSDERYELNGAINVPLSEGLAARVAGHWINRDGFGVSSVTGQEFGDDNNYTILGQLLWEPSADLTIRLTADVRHEDTAPAHSFVTDVDPAEFTAVPGPGGNLIQPPGLFFLVGYNQILRPTITPTPPPILSSADLIATDPSVNSSSVVGSDMSTVWGFSSTIDWAASESLTVKSITGYRALDVEFNADNDATVHPISSIDADISQWQFSQELQFIGDTGDLEWLAGLFFFKENADDTTTNLIFADRYDALEYSAINIITLPCAVAPIPGPPGCAGNPANFGLDTNLLTMSEIDVTNYAGFVHGVYSFSEAFSLEAGVRLSYEEKEFTTSLTRLASGIPAVPETTVSDDWFSVTPRVSLNFEPIDDVLLYVSASRGFKSGTFNGRSLSQGFVVPVEPERLWTYEAGFKTTFADGRARLNAAFFYNDYSDVQLQFVEVSPAGAIVQFDNAGDAEIYGAEVEFVAKPTDSIDIILSGGYSDSELKNVDAAAAAAGFVEGTKLSKTPEFSFVAAAQHTLELPGFGSLRSRVDYSWTDEFFHQRNEDPLSLQESYGLLGARLTLITANDNFEVSAFGTNLTDEEYFNVIVVGSTRVATGYPARGRQWGVSAKYRF